jgi:RNA polymerase sigma-70 factor, ECF subfamily
MKGLGLPIHPVFFCLYGPHQKQATQPGQDLLIYLSAMSRPMHFYPGVHPNDLDSRNRPMNENPSNPIVPPERSTHRDLAHRKETLHAGAAAQPADDVLLDRVRANDQIAMADLFDRYGGMVFSVALRILKDRGQAEDVMQDIFCQFWKKPDAFTVGKGSLGGWLLVVARNRAIDSLRRVKHTDSPDDVVLASNSNLASETERNSMMDKARAVLQELPQEQQMSIELAYFEGLSHSEIATRTGDPLGTVKTRIRLALITLRKALQA